MFRKFVQLVSGNLLNTFLATIFGIYIARQVGPDTKGVLALATASVALLSIFFGCGMHFSSAYFIRRKPEAASLVLKYINRAVLVSGILSLSLLFLGKNGFSRLFLDGRNFDFILILLMVASVVVGVENIMLGSSVIAKGDARAYTRANLLANITTIIVTLIVLFSTEAKIHSVLGGALLGQLVSTFIYRRQFNNYISEHPPSDLTFWEFLSYGLKLQIGLLSNLFFKRADLFIVGYFLSPAAVGYYSIGLGLREMGIIVPRAATSLVAGDLADPKKKLNFKKKLLLKVLAGVCAFSLAVGILGHLFFPYLIPLVYTGAFREAAAPSVLILWSLLPIALASVFANAIAAEGNPIPWSIGNLISAALGGLLIWHMTKSNGLQGAAYATILAGFIQLLAGALVFFFTSEMCRRRRPDNGRP